MWIEFQLTDEVDDHTTELRGVKYYDSLDL